MSDYEITNFELRVLLRHYWRQNLDAKAAAEAICHVEGEGTMAPRTAQKWFKRFNEGDFDLEDRQRSGRPTVLDEGDLQAALDIAPSSNTRELAEELGVDHKTVWNHLKQLGFVHKKPRQDPHELTEAQAAKRVEICRQLLNNPLDDRFWKRIVTSDEKWVYLVNHDRSKRWVPKGQTPPSVPKQNQFGKKIMICVWWNFEGILHFELVPNGRAINAELYCERYFDQIRKLADRWQKVVENDGLYFEG